MTEKPQITKSIEITEFTGPLTFKDTPKIREKLLFLNDAFFDTWDEVAMVTACFHDGSVAVHVLVASASVYGSDGSYNERLFQKFEGWLAGYLAGSE